MGVITYLGDRLQNLVANLGTGRDKAASSAYVIPQLTDIEAINAYKGAWIPAKIVDIPPLDATRNWRNWQAEGEDITLIEAEEKRLGLRGAIRTTLTRARLFGGAAIYIGTADADPSQPLDASRIGRGGLRYLTTLNRRQLSAGTMELDPASPLFGKPREYMLSTPNGMLTIHPSRLVVFVGKPTPDPELETGPNYGWGDSVLLSCMEAVKNSDAATANVASLIFEAKVDVFKIPNFMENLESPEYRTRILERFRLAAMGKGINGALVLDAEEDYQQKSASFAQLPEIMASMLQQVSGAADIPITRLLGQSPSGMNATGDSDTRNYYDRIRAMQELDIGPAMAVLDECLIRSALGDRPESVFYDWASLWQTTATEKADIGKKAAETIATLAGTGLYPDDALSKASVNMLTELSVMPGLESAIAESPEPDPSDNEAAVGNTGTARAPEDTDDDPV